MDIERKCYSDKLRAAYVAGIHNKWLETKGSGCDPSCEYCGYENNEGYVYGYTKYLEECIDRVYNATGDTMELDRWTQNKR